MKPLFRFFQRITHFVVITAANRRIPILRQSGVNDCGAACLAMALRQYGRYVTVEQIRQILGPSARGTNLHDLVRAANAYDLEAEAVSINAEDLRTCPSGTILHWDQQHFVIVAAFRRRRLIIIDPAIGRRAISLHSLRRHFSGAALIVSPRPSFTLSVRPRRALRGLGRELLNSRSVLLKWALISLAAPMLGLVGPYLTRLVVDRIVPSRDYRLLALVSIGLVGFIFVQASVAFLRSRILLALRLNVDSELASQFVEHLLELPMDFFRRHSTGDILSRASSHVTVRNFITSSAFSVVVNICMVVTYLALLLRASVSLTLIALVLGVCQLSVLVVTRQRRRELAVDSLRDQAQASAHNVEMLLGIEVIKAMGGEPEALQRWKSYHRTSRDILSRQGHFESWSDAFQTAARMTTPLVLLTFGAIQVLRGSLSLGHMLALNAIAAGFLAPLAGVTSVSTNGQMASRELDRLDDVLAVQPERHKFGVTRTPQIDGHIRLDNVSFAYTPLLPPAVQSLSLDIPAGSLVVVVGRSGSGKSTLGRLLLGLCQPSSGAVHYDGTNLLDIDIRWFRRHVGYMTQHPFIFSDTVLSNILLGRSGLCVDDIIAAARLAGIHDDIMALPHSYDTILDNRGSCLSGGQQQRIALARALAGTPRILLLDEATSHLDAHTESDVWRSIVALRCTRVVVTHRIRCTSDAHLVVVMERGRVVEMGAPDVLYRDQGSYADLMRASAPRSDLQPV